MKVIEFLIKWSIYAINFIGALVILMGFCLMDSENVKFPIFTILAGLTFLLVGFLLRKVFDNV